MVSVGVLCERVHQAEFEGRIPPELVHNKVGDGYWVLEESGSYCYLDRDDGEDVLLGYEAATKELILSRLADPVDFDLAYRDIEFCKRLLLRLADDPRTVVDDGFGLVLPGDEFARRIRENPGWDWRVQRRV
jgi:hypothetical protein